MKQKKLTAEEQEQMENDARLEAALEEELQDPHPLERPEVLEAILDEVERRKRLPNTAQQNFQT